MKKEVWHVPRSEKKEIEAFIQRTKRFTRRQVLVGGAGVVAAAALSTLAIDKLVRTQTPVPEDPTKVTGHAASEISAGRSSLKNPAGL